MYFRSNLTLTKVINTNQSLSFSLSLLSALLQTGAALGVGLRVVLLDDPRSWPVRSLVLVLVVRPPDGHADGGLVPSLVLVDLRHLAHVHLGFFKDLDDFVRFGGLGHGGDVQDDPLGHAGAGAGGDDGEGEAEVAEVLQ